MLKVHIFDVEHGACNVAETPSGHLIMIDCGHNSSTGWRPSNWIVANGLNITNLTVSNIDEDHVSDLVNIDRRCRPQTFKTNYHLTAEWIKRKKLETGGVGLGVQQLLNYVQDVFTGDGITIDYGLERVRFCHPPTKFSDFNNLSLVNFIFYAGIGILFPGDLETEGWIEFLRDQSFRQCLGRTNLFIASHHGRESGYCEEVFSFCSPTAFIISDKSVEHDTQTHNLYSQHASGLVFNGERRKVLTTRNDGKITIEVPTNGDYIVRIHS